VIRERRKPKGSDDLRAERKNGIFVSNRPSLPEGGKEKVILAGTNEASVFNATIRVI
jgi:hypothetical protein